MHGKKDRLSTDYQVDLGRDQLEWAIVRNFKKFTRMLHSSKL